MAALPDKSPQHTHDAIAGPTRGARLRGCLLRLFAAAFGLLLALLIVEIGVRLVYRALPQGLQIALQDVRITPFSDARLIPPPIWQTDNDYQTITRPGLSSELAFGSPDVSFHVSTYAWWGGRIGFRSPQPTDGHLDSVALGDSFTFCFTDAPSCWVDELASATGLSIGNLGQPVTGSQSHARIFKTFALPIKPPLVIWQFFGNDFNDDYGLAQLDGTARTPPESVQAPPQPTAPIAIWLREHSVIYALISALLRRNEGIDQFVDPYHVTGDGFDLWFGQSYVRKAFDMTNPRNMEGEGYSQQALLSTRDLVESYSGHLLIVLMPTKEEVYRARTAPVMGTPAIDAISTPRQHMLDFCAVSRLTCLDLLPTLQAQAEGGTQGYYPRDMHLNAQGNTAVSDAIKKFLESQGWIK